LFFNEADAILGSRGESSRPAEQLINAVQNLLLQRLEDFQGIFVAATNLPGLLDPAFDRRFLYKIAMQIPGPLVAKRIILKRFPLLTENEAERVAKQVQLTGGNYYNLEKQILIWEIISGDKLSASEVVKLLLAEGSMGLRKKGHRIGFISSDNM
jgi:SpoVK/Ycf46/Vps4 family AAA+-type ATPase